MIDEPSPKLEVPSSLILTQKFHDMIIHKNSNNFGNNICVIKVREPNMAIILTEHSLEYAQKTPKLLVLKTRTLLPKTPS